MLIFVLAFAFAFFFLLFPSASAVLIHQCKNNGQFALTFDEGPIIGLTSQILATLAAKNAPATFHISTQNFNDPAVIALAQSIAVAGQLVGLRFPPQLNLTTMTEADISSVLDNNIDSFDTIFEIRPQFLRFPYQQASDAIVALAESKGLIVTEFNLDSMDYEANANVLFNFQTALANALPSLDSFISSQHDYSAQSVQQLGAIIDMIRGKGYTLVTLANCVGVTAQTPPHLTAVPVPPTSTASSNPLASASTTANSKSSSTAPSSPSPSPSPSTTAASNNNHSQQTPVSPSVDGLSGNSNRKLGPPIFLPFLASIFLFIFL